MNDALPVWVQYLILFVFAVAAIGFAVAYFKERKKNRELRQDFDNTSSDNERLNRYYVDAADREALVNFIGDNLDDVANPHRSAVIRIITSWGSTR